MKIIEGLANVYKEVSGEYHFDYSVFVYPNHHAADSAMEKQGTKEHMMQVGGRPVKVRIEIPEITEPEITKEVEENAVGSELTKTEG